MAPPPFAKGPGWRKRFSNAANTRAWYDPQGGFEYVPCRKHGHGGWHQINPQTGYYRHIDPYTGEPLAGHLGEWRRLL